MTSLDFDNVTDLALGCAILGGGGGGDPLTGLRLARETFSTWGAVPVVTADALPAGGLVLPCALVGAPTIALEKVPSGDEGHRLVAETEDALGLPVVALMALEIGGLNGVLPVSWAARLDLPLIDADGMGRAFPLVTQTTMNLAGVDPNPCVLTDERGNAMVLKGIDSDWTERLVRPAVAGLGGACALSMYPIRSERAAACTVAGSITRALRVGAAADGPDPVAAVTDAVGGHTLIEGKILEVTRDIDGWLTSGYAVIEEIDGAATRRLLRLDFQNENVAALEDGELLASTPDVLSLLDAVTGHAIIVERLRYGQRVRLIAFPSAPAWRAADGLALTGPGAFGYAMAYKGVPARDV